MQAFTFWPFLKKGDRVVIVVRLLCRQPLPATFNLLPACGALQCAKRVANLCSAADLGWEEEIGQQVVVLPLNCCSVGSSSPLVPPEVRERVWLAQGR